MPNYDTRYDPPAPMAQVVLRNPNTGVLLPDVSLILDTGADITLLPRAAIQQLGVQPLSGLEYELRGFDGQKSIT